MKQFVPVEMKIIVMNLQDIISTSEEPTEATGTTNGNGEIITPPDEFDHD